MSIAIIAGAFLRRIRTVTSASQQFYLNGAPGCIGKRKLSHIRFTFYADDPIARPNSSRKSRTSVQHIAHLVARAVNTTCDSAYVITLRRHFSLTAGFPGAVQQRFQEEVSLVVSGYELTVACFQRRY